MLYTGFQEQYICLQKNGFYLLWLLWAYAVFLDNMLKLYLINEY